MKKTFVNPIVWQGGIIRIIDQTKLPGEVRHEECRSPEDIWQAIKKLKVRGAPLIGIAGALGFLLGVQKTKSRQPRMLLKEGERLRRYLGSSRPTAVNLFWALRRMQETLNAHAKNSSYPRLLAVLKREVEDIIKEDIEMCFKMSEYGSRLIKKGGRLMTVCNAGGLATSGYGTALGVFYRAHEEGKKIKVYACETRPLLQGARLTTWELMHNGIDVTLICDNMAADLMRRGRIDAVFVGADRIAANGDFANKIGTYSLAVLARHHGMPFYCVAPSSTLDLSCPDGKKIPIEERDAAEVTSLYFKKPIAPSGVKVFNPAFDVTPAELTAAIVTERGVIRPPFRENIKALHA